MLADYEDIASYLLDRELISAERIVAGDLTIVDLSRRHSNFKVIGDDGPGYFLKQDVDSHGTGGGPPDTPFGEDFATVSYEAKVYRLLEEKWRANRQRRHFPRCHRFDPIERLLVLEAVAGSQSLADYHYRSGRFSSLVARELGKTLAAVHRVFRGEKEGTGCLRSIPENRPWVFFLPRPTIWLYLNSSSANLEFLKIAQADEVLESLFDELRRRWTTDTLIHGDLKWTNCLVVPGSAHRGARIKLVDWELACRGDAWWDVGSIFSEYLNLWLSSIPISGDEPPDRYLDVARFPLRRMQPSIRAFWRSYAHHAGIARRDVEERLVRAVKYSAARLVQTAFEQLQDQSTVANGAICRLQLCRNILERPAEAAVQLLGLPLPGSLQHD